MDDTFTVLRPVTWLKKFILRVDIVAASLNVDLRYVCVACSRP